VVACLGIYNEAAAMDAAVATEQPDKPCGYPEPIFQSYQPTTLGYTKQSDDEWFLNFTISFKAPLFRSLLCNHLGGRGHLYLTFTGNFAFYVATRHSGPVLGREYNPKLLWRFIFDPSDTRTISSFDRRPVTVYASYIDFAYAHSSNGQSIDTQQEFDIQARQSKSTNDALDYISRGWDYLQVAAKETISAAHGREIVIYPDFKFFLRHGLLQGVPEEWHSWEVDTTLRPRHAFDGISTAVEYWPYEDQPAESLRSSVRFQVRYTTGYDPVARYNTFRGEFGFSPWGLPLAVWAQDGYMYSLARYYKKASAVGVELRFATIDY
jgi:hypothetical protein